MTEPQETSAGETGGREARDVAADLDGAELLAVARAHHDSYEQSHSHPGAFACCSAHTSADDVPELIAEVERRRELEQSYIIALDQASIGDVQRAVARAETAERELDGMRERVGEVTVKWAVHWRTGGGRDHYEPCIDEQEAREAIPDLADGYTVVWRAVGEWREVGGGERKAADDHACDNCDGIDPGSCMTREAADGG